MGQSIEDLSVDERGTCRQDFEDFTAARKGNDISQEEFDATINSRSQIVVPDATLFRYSNLSEPLGAEPLGFGEHVVTYAVLGAGSEQRYFVKAPARDQCGWISRADVFAVRNPLPLRRLPGYEATADVRGGESRLTAKVVALNIRRGDDIFRVPLFSKPVTIADQKAVEKAKIGEIGYFAIMDVYDHQTPAREPCEDIEAEDCFILVGGLSESPDRESASVPVLKGWVQGRSVALWPSALSLYYSPDVKGAVVYKTEDDAESQTKDESGIVGYQDDRYGEPDKQNIPRFPVVTGVRQSERYIYQMVFAGEACPEQRQAECVPSPEFLARSGDIFRRLDTTRAIDVLFVIDGTRSMTRYYPAVIKAVDNYTDKARKQNLRMRFAVATYGDYVGVPGTAEKGKVQLDFVTRFTMVNDGSQVSRLYREKHYADPHEDASEATFAGIIRSATDAGWSNEAAFKLVIVIGDHGNRTPGRHATPRGSVNTVEEKVAVGDVVASLQKFGLIFAAIQVPAENRSQEARAAFAAFDTQMDSIAQDLAPKGLGAERITETGSDDVRQVQAAVEKRLEEITITIADIGKYVDDAINLRDPSRASSLALVRLSDYVREHDLGITDERLKAVAGSIQDIRYGFVLQEEGGPHWAYWLGLRTREFDPLYDAMKALCETMGSIDGALYDKVKTAMIRVVEAVTFEEPPEEGSVAEFLEKKWSVPRDRFSELLNQSLSDFARQYSEMSPQDQSRHRGTICRKAALLDFVAREKRVALEDIVINDQDRAELKKGAKAEDFYWDWMTDGGSRYYFLPLAFLP